jgi:succinate-semialdehyde dehydrogenase/glutarate-semialdehyde dehydrogenase
MNIQTINPTNEEVIATYSCLSEREINQRLEKGHAAYLTWKRSDFKLRAKHMAQLTHLLTDNKKELATLMALEMGKPITAGQAEIEKCARLCEHYIEHAEDYLAPRLIQTEMNVAKVCHNPLGIVFGIMPGIFPFGRYLGLQYLLLWQEMLQY